MEAIAERQTLMPVAQDAVPAPTGLAVVTPMHMLQAAIERGADLTVLQQFMDLNDRWEANEARKAFVAAMAKFKANPPEILKAQRVSFKTDKGMTEYTHAGLADVCTAATKGLAEVGISHRWEVKQEAAHITVTCLLTHAMGHSEVATMTASPDGSGGKNGIQAIGSTITYLQRYTLLSATGLAAKEMDDDGASAGKKPDVISENQAADLAALADEVKADMAGFLRFLKVERLADLPAKKLRAATEALEAKRRTPAPK